ncbi:hypothetical protein [Breznakia pachnodae]|uniref:Uncharacterized protein n=1 Tax=Breznakia pachnodae TaxID=265178 RepID=A0ABU0E3Y1_9FIRM|nr:hypothetical protein [Breznakia pachnodae]MDQ0361597.1 hypothetical protein [Breznakia pachnodae]
MFYQGDIVTAEAEVLENTILSLSAEAPYYSYVTYEVDINDVDILEQLDKRECSTNVKGCSERLGES